MKHLLTTVAGALLLSACAETTPKEGTCVSVRTGKTYPGRAYLSPGGNVVYWEVSRSEIWFQLSTSDYASWECSTTRPPAEEQIPSIGG